MPPDSILSDGKYRNLVNDRRGAPGRGVPLSFSGGGIRASALIVNKKFLVRKEGTEDEQLSVVQFL